MRSGIRRHLLDNVELYLTALGLVVIFATPVAVDLGSPAAELAATAIAVGVLHGVVFWAVRRRQRKVRRELLRRVRTTLSRRVDQELGRVLANVQPPDRDLTPTDRERLAEVATAVRDIAAAIEAVSLESLDARAGLPSRKDAPYT